MINALETGTWQMLIMTPLLSAGYAALGKLWMVERRSYPRKSLATLRASGLENAE